MGSNLNGKACTCLLMQGLALSPFLGSFIDKQQGGSVRGLQAFIEQRPCFDKCTLPSENSGREMGDEVVASSVAFVSLSHHSTQRLLLVLSLNH